MLVPPCNQSTQRIRLSTIRSHPLARSDFPRAGRPKMPVVRFRQLAAIGLVLACAACATAPSSAGAASIKVGALFPLSGPQAPLAKQEYAGVQIARDLVNADGGGAGAPIPVVAKGPAGPGDAGPPG